MKKYIILAVGLIVVFAGNKVLADNKASAIANALQTVINAITINKKTDLNFGEAAQGTPGLAIPADAAGGASRASFEVKGEPNKDYSISLPGNGVVTMLTAEGDTPNKKINVFDFTSNPAPKGNLGAAGIETLFVGASRDPILGNQVTGAYVAPFTVTVQY